MLYCKSRVPGHLCHFLFLTCLFLQTTMLLCTALHPNPLPKIVHDALRDSTHRSRMVPSAFLTEGAACTLLSPCPVSHSR